MRWFVWSLLSPSQLILYALLAGVLLLALRRPRAATVCLVASAAAVLVFGLLPTSHWLAHVLETRFPQPTLPEQVAGIILLAGAEEGDLSAEFGVPQVGGSGGRYVTTLALAQRYPDARIVFTGGPRREAGREPLETQAAVAEALFAAVGIDSARITWEEGSRDTCDSGRNTLEQLRPAEGPPPWVVVTSALHVPRTAACFRAGGWTAAQFVMQPADHRTSGIHLIPRSVPRIARNLALLDEAAHEWVGLAYYRVTGRTTEWFPAPI
jgi:uncharacterized SAM-binding protein YcdF (DUF218 family)